MIKRIIRAFTAACLMGVAPSALAEEIELRSPDSQLKVMVSTDALTYRVMYRETEILSPSRLGMVLAGEEAAEIFTIDAKEFSTENTFWQPVVGKRKQVLNHYNELELTVVPDQASSRKMKVVFRAYNEGVAFRYILGVQDRNREPVSVETDRSEFNFADQDMVAWSYVPEQRPMGPEPIGKMAEQRAYPFVAKSSKGYWIAIAEAALHDFPNFNLYFTPGRPCTAGISHATVQLPFETPWRVLMIADAPEAFVDSDLLVNLSPSPEGDFSWVKPGVALWDWRAWGHQTRDGFKYDLEIESWRRFIDFAAEKEIPYLLLDANWYGPEHSTLSDPFKGGKAAQVKQALEYGREKGVGLILYLNDKASVNFSIEEIAKAYADWGAVGIKYGFMSGHGQEKVKKTERVVKACAENKLLVNFHDGPIPPTGHERTWPNWNTREYVHAQSDAKRSHAPGDFVLMAYLNTIAGPIDGNHGLFDHENSVAQRPRIFQEVYSTIVAEAARTLILYSGLTVVPDSPDAYREHPGLFGFIAAQKQPWKQSKTVAGEFGTWITTMRQAGDGTFLVATATDESPRTVQLPLDFLPPGVSYDATIFRDADDAHYKTNRSAYETGQRTVSRGDVIQAAIAPGGGHCVILRPKQ